MNGFGRRNALSSPAYWTTVLQIDFYQLIKDYSVEELSKLLEIKQYEAKQLLAGDWDRKISKLVEYATKLGYCPKVSFITIDEQLELEKQRRNEREKSEV